jgi:hypothetical protein
MALRRKPEGHLHAKCEQLHDMVASRLSPLFTAGSPVKSLPRKVAGRAPACRAGITVIAAADIAAVYAAGIGGYHHGDIVDVVRTPVGRLAANLLDGRGAVNYDPVPYLWSDQYEHKFQIVGRVSARDQTTLVHGSLRQDRFAVAYSRDGKLRGIVVADMPDVADRARRS